MLDALAHLPAGSLPDKPLSAWTVRKMAERQCMRQEQRERAADPGAAASALHNLDFRLAGSVVADDSVDLIFTDPPYAEQDPPLYAALGKFAARVLRPGGLLLSYAGQSHLPRVLSSLGESLIYFWSFAVMLANTRQSMWYLQFRAGWKPIVAFYKPPLRVWWGQFLDSVSGGREKEFHPWQQDEQEAEHYIRHLCPEGGLVCDPFAGSGTTLVAAERLGRRHVGFEIDAKTAERARLRLAEAAAR